MLKFINAACAFQKQKNTRGKQESLVCSSLFLLKSIFVLSSSGVNNFNEKEKIARWSLSSGIYRLRWFLEIQKTGEQSSKSPGEIVYNPLKSIFFKKPQPVVLLQVGWPGATWSSCLTALWAGLESRWGGLILLRFPKMVTPRDVGSMC